jgi:hypothetical protein
MRWRLLSELLFSISIPLNPPPPWENQLSNSPLAKGAGGLTCKKYYLILSVLGYHVFRLNEQAVRNALTEAVIIIDTKIKELEIRL